MSLRNFNISALVLSVSIMNVWQCDAKEVAKVNTKAAVPASTRKTSRNAVLRWAVTPITSASLPTPIREEVEAVHLGMTRDEFDKHFDHDNGLGTMFYIGEGNYHCTEGNHRVHLTVSFKASDPTGNITLLAKVEKYHWLYLTEEEKHTFLFGNAHDTIMKVSSLWTFAPIHEAP